MTKYVTLATQKIASRSRAAAVAALLVVAAGALGCQPLPDAPVERGEKLYHNCEACHGPTGEGNVDYQAPAIAGLQSWYVENQLTKFRTGLRGAHADDIEGMRMRPLSKSLLHEGDVKAVAAYVAQMKPKREHPKTVQGDPGRGAEYFKTCTACHGAGAEGQQALNAPALVYSQDWYLLRQLHKFQDGVRGGMAGDTTGAQMAGMINAVPDDQAKQDVVAYIQKLRRTTGGTK